MVTSNKISIRYDICMKAWIVKFLIERLMTFQLIIIIIEKDDRFYLKINVCMETIKETNFIILCLQLHKIYT